MPIKAIPPRFFIAATGTGRTSWSWPGDKTRGGGGRRWQPHTVPRKGPTAVLNSCAKIDTLQTYNHLINQKYLPQFLEGDLKPVFLDYLKTWREKKVPHIQFNVVDRKTLVDAQDYPEKYRDLIVRVAGYSAYFGELSKGLQDHIIARTEQSLS